MKKICVTGANGFIGKHLCEALILRGKIVKGFVRDLNSDPDQSKINFIPVGDISLNINWTDKIRGYDCVVHCAGKAHLINEKNEVESYHTANTQATQYLAEQAAMAGVRRLVFLSTIKVNGERTGKIEKQKVFKNYDTPNPHDAYSKSKLEAEKKLWQIASKTGLEVVIVRLPLVYGYGVKGNLARLIKLIDLGIPLPLKLVKNKRSMIGIDNLIDILVRCIEDPRAKDKTFLVSDNEDLATQDLLRYIALSMGKSIHFFSFPISLLKLFAYIIGKTSEIDRLTDSLQIDISYTQKTLNWIPSVDVQTGLKKMLKNK